MTPEQAQLLEEHFNNLVAEVRMARGEILATRTIAVHALGLLIKQSQNPAVYFKIVHETSRENIYANVAFDGGNAEGNKEIHRNALVVHDAIFKSIGAALKLDGSTP